MVKSLIPKNIAVALLVLSSIFIRKHIVPLLFSFRHQWTRCFVAMISSIPDLHVTLAYRLWCLLINQVCCLLRMRSANDVEIICSDEGLTLQMSALHLTLQPKHTISISLLRRRPTLQTSVLYPTLRRKTFHINPYSAYSPTQKKQGFFFHC